MSKLKQRLDASAEIEELRKAFHEAKVHNTSITSKVTSLYAHKEKAMSQNAFLIQKATLAKSKNSKLKKDLENYRVMYKKVNSYYNEKIQFIDDLLAWIEKEKDVIYHDTLMDAQDYVKSVLEHEFDWSGIEFHSTWPTKS